MHAQSSCSSDGVARPAALVERFINADCQGCWSDAKTPAAGKGEVALDWVLPGSRGDDAPLSSVARRDAVQRLAALKQAPPAEAATLRAAVVKQPRSLRVAQGLAFNGYVAASIELKPGTGGPWTAWLALVETVPAGIEGSPVERNLVRNVLQATWNNDQPLSREERMRRIESRSMNLPEGANPQRMRVVGWVEDARGRIVAAAQSRCDATQ
ncbi:hypothetical protein GHT07_05225 [Caenimonas koreensis DSM 17982]|uniref:Uncharacterized protein n=1 Tax=Caenimonas koreensis DSM 17982 TaxID=1121255 RepID=A0A844B5R6_9BURK|nr:hypothetical protein [Caenimonas koreensis DSM 17982]